MDHISAMKLLVNYLEKGQSNGLFSIEDSAKIYNAQVIMNNYFVNNANNTNVSSNPVQNVGDTSNELVESLRKENELLKNRNNEFEQIKVKLMSRNIELDNLRRNYNKKIEELNKYRNIGDVSMSINEENNDNVLKI